MEEKEEENKEKILIRRDTHNSRTRSVLSPRYSSPNNDDFSLSKPLFPYLPSFSQKTRKEKYFLFMKAFEEKTLQIRTKELKSSNSPVEPLLPPETISEILNTRNSLFERVKETEIRKTISRSKTESDPTPANFVK